jgi:hypothetical protein
MMRIPFNPEAIINEAARFAGFRSSDRCGWASGAGFLMMLFIIFYGCTRDMPTQKDGLLAFETIIIDKNNILPVDPELGYAPLIGTPVMLESRKYFETPESSRRYTSVTDSAGWVYFENLQAASYTLSVKTDILFTNPETQLSDTVLLQASALVDIFEPHTVGDTIQTNTAAISPLVINEIYYCGPPNKAFYFYDQFVELYNKSNDTVYLDGMILCRGRQYQHPEMETNDFVQAIYVFQFPGAPLTGREYPLAPHEITVVAGDAYNHSQIVTTALDLSFAQWEFYNPYGGDFDTPAPNVSNILPETTVDFLINLSHNAVILADGSNFYYGEVREAGGQYIHIPIKNVLDAVEYASSIEKQKEVTSRVDAGFAGVGISKYSGKSTERRIIGFDTNNSSLDFINLDAPTPGYQHP